MTRGSIGHTLAFIALGFLLGACEQRVSYLDDDFPGLTPKKYAEGIINIPGRFQQNMTLSSDGREHFFTQTDGEIWRYERILRITQSEGQVVLDTPQFVIDFSYEHEWFIGEPMLSADNQYLFFVADFPPNLWQSKRGSKGDWAKPVKMKISTSEGDWYPTTSLANDLYFTNGTVFRSQGDDFQSKVAMNLCPKDVRDPILSANGDFIVYTLEIPEGFGQADLYVSFAEEKSWTSPRNLGAEINTESIEFAPSFSPDGKYLFFSRRDQWQKAQFSDIYWVSLEVVLGNR